MKSFANLADGKSVLIGPFMVLWVALLPASPGKVPMPSTEALQSSKVSAPLCLGIQLAREALRLLSGFCFLTERKGIDFGLILFCF